MSLGILESLKKDYTYLDKVKKDKELSKLLSNRSKDAIIGRVRQLGLSDNIKIQCVETGQIFASIKDAATFLNNPKAAGSILACLRGEKPTTYGYHWEYVEEEN